MVEPRWYVIDKIGTVTLCADAEDARDVSMTSDQAYPQNAPHRAVQLVAVTSMESVRAQHSRDSKTLREYAQARDDLRKERDRLREALSFAEPELVMLSTELERINRERPDLVAVLPSLNVLSVVRAALAQEGS